MNLLDEAYGVDYALTNLYEQAEAEIAEDGEIALDTQRCISELEGDRDRAITCLASWCLATRARLDAAEATHKPLIERLRGELKELADRLDFIKGHISRLMPKDREAQVVNEKVYCYQNPVDRVEVLEPEAVPIELCRVKYEPDLEKIEKELRQPGDTGIEFARIDTRWNPTVKPGGEKAIKNAKVRVRKLVKEREAENNIRQGSQPSVTGDRAFDVGKTGVVPVENPEAAPETSPAAL
jgi:hypothetical protein